MSKKCELTGKIPMKGHNVSHANNKTKRGSFDEYLKVVKNKNLSPRLKKLKKGILIKSPFKKKPVAKSA